MKAYSADIYAEVRNPLSEPTAVQAIPTSESHQQPPVAVVGSENLQKKLGARKAFLDKRRKTKGYSLKDWAKQAGVAVSTVRGYWSGKTNPHPSTLWKLAQALGISIEEMPR